MTSADGNLQATQHRLEVAPGVRLHFSVWSGAEHVILLESGGGESLSQWGDLAPDLLAETGATVVAYSRAGFGESDLPETPYDMEEELEWLMDGLRRLKLDHDLLLVGHSYGGWLIRLIVDRHPECVRGLVFVDPFSHEFVERAGVDVIDRMNNADSLEVIPEAERTKKQRADIRMMHGGVRRKFEIMKGTAFPADLPYRVMTCGETDWLGPGGTIWRSVHEGLARKTPRGRLIVVEGVRHMIPADAPDAILRAVQDVLADMVAD